MADFSPQHAILWVTLLFYAHLSAANDDLVRSPELGSIYVVNKQPGPTLECTIDKSLWNNATYERSWTRYAHGIRHVSRNDRLLQKETVFQLLESPSTGTYNLKISKMDPEYTVGSFQCSVLDLNTGIQYDSVLTEVLELVEPGAPEIIWSPSNPIHEGEGVSLKCRTEGGSPTPSISWLFDNKTEADMDLHNEISKGAALESTIHWRARPEDNGAFLTCVVDNKALDGKSPKTVQSPRLNILYKPTVTAGPVQDFSVEEGQQISLSCSGEGNPQPTSFEWKHLLTGERYLSSKWSFAAERRLTGDFECRAQNTVGEATDKLTLNVQYKPVVTTKEIVNPAEGDTVTLDCVIDANPREESVQWSGPNGFTARGTKLILPSISKEQSGNYTCAATNYLSLYGQSGSQPRTGYSTVIVDVRRKPGQARITPPVFTVDVGGTIQLNCAAMDVGSPVASYKWASPTSGGQFGTPEHSRDVLIINNAQLSDNGEYKCMPYNTIGEGGVGSVTVVVVEPATISRPLTSERVYTTGEQATGLECEAQGFPAPDISWYKDGSPVNTNRFVADTTKSNSCSATDFCTHTVTSTLVFKNPVEWSDKGNFSCQANNGGMVPAATWSVIRVVHGPQILNEQYNGESLAASDVRTTARISCRVSARPKPSFVWLRDSTAIDDGDRYSITQNKLAGTIDEYESVLSFADATEADYGQYLCRATNGKGEKAEVIIRLREKSSPQSVTELQTLSSSPSSLFVGWKPGFDGGYYQTFVLEYRKVNPFNGGIVDEEVTVVDVTNLQRATVNTNTNRAKRSPHSTTLVAYNLTNLSPMSKYYFRVRSKNELGMSEFTDSLGASTQDVYEDPSIDTPVSVTYNIQNDGLNIEPTATADVCIQLYVSQGGEFHGAGCWPSDRKIKELLGGKQFRARFCSKSRNLMCSPLSPIAVAPAPLATKWRLAVPVVIGVLIALLLTSMLLVCCRSRNGKVEKKKKHVEIRPEVSGPMPPPEAKNTIIHGSATDSGVFTLDNGNKGQENGHTYSANETVAERDSWPAERQVEENFDPFHNDPYLTEYGNSGWHNNAGADVHDGGNSAENATTSTHDTGDSDSDAYSGGGRVIREIIV